MLTHNITDSYMICLIFKNIMKWKRNKKITKKNNNIKIRTFRTTVKK